MDHKMAAANDQESALLNSESESKSKSMTEYSAEALLFLETFTGKQLGTAEAEQWIARLSKYPKWKIDRLVDYTGRLDNGVFAFLDSQKPLPEAHHAAPALPNPAPVGIAKACMDHIKRITEFEGPLEERRKIELDGLKKLHANYPNAGFGKSVNQRMMSK